MTLHDDPLVFRHGGGWQLWLLSIPGFVLAFVFLGMFLTVDRTLPNVPLRTILAAAGFSALCGIAIVSMRWHKSISVSDGKVMDSFKIFGLGRKRFIPLSEFSAITTPARSASSQGGTRYTRYHVWIVGPEKRVYLTEFNDQERALEVARRVAQKTGLVVRR